MNPELLNEIAALKSALREAEAMISRILSDPTFDLQRRAREPVERMHVRISELLRAK